MAAKRILCRERVRRVPRAFSWVDHRLVRDGHISRCSHEALALYLFLITVADADGLSYYSGAAVCRFLNMDQAILAKVRTELCEAGLLAYSSPLYQVLSLEETGGAVRVKSQPARRGSCEVVSIGDILGQRAGGAQ